MWGKNKDTMVTSVFSVLHVKQRLSCLRVLSTSNTNIVNSDVGFFFFNMCSLSTGQFYSFLRIFVVNWLKQVLLHTGAAAICFSSIFSFNIVVKVFGLLHFIWKVKKTQLQARLPEKSSNESSRSYEWLQWTLSSSPVDKHVFCTSFTSA